MLTWSVSSITLAEVTHLELHNVCKHTHTYAQMHRRHQSRCFSSTVSIHVHTVEARSNTSNSPPCTLSLSLCSLFLSLFHPLHSLSVVLRHVLFAPLPLQLNTLNPAFLSLTLSFSLSIPPSFWSFAQGMHF